MKTPTNIIRPLAAALLLTLGSIPAGAQLGPYTLLNGGTNGTPTNGVFYPDKSVVKIALGNYSTIGLHTEARTIAAEGTNGWSIGWVRTVNGTRWESNVWQVTELPLGGTGRTNLWFTNLTVGPFHSIAPLWISNRNVNAHGTNCLTNVWIQYFSR